MHLGDLHIGKTLGDFDLIDDQEYMLNQVITLAKEHTVDMVLLAGDIYDKSIPSEAAVRLFDQFVRSLVENHLQVCMISGNHDSDERLNFGSSLFEANGVYISSKYQGSLYKKTFEDSHGKVNLYLLPFVKASQVKRYYPDAEINSYEDAVRVLLENTDINTQERNVMVAHQFVTGGMSDPDLGGSEGLSVKNVGTVEKIGADCFEKLDYVALGHIHSAQAISRETIRYAGSPLKYSLSEAEHKKSIPLVTLGKKGEIEIELLPIKPLRDLRHIKGKMQQLLNAENVSDTDDFIYVTLTEDDIISDAMAIFQQIYPNTVKIDYDNEHTKEVDDIDLTDITRGKSFQELFTEFYQQMYGCEITEEELELVNQIAREAGAIDETN